MRSPYRIVSGRSDEWRLLFFVRLAIELLTTGSQAADGAGVQLFASRSKSKFLSFGSTLSGSNESWDRYCDYEWLLDQGFTRTIVISGDIHANVFRRHSGRQELVEVISSGAAQPRIGGDVGNYGMLDFADDHVTISLYDRPVRPERKL